MTTKKEYGDFQTPGELCVKVVQLLARRLSPPATVVEPTCGLGSFLVAAHDQWPDARLIGFDRNEEYLAAARHQLGSAALMSAANFFDMDWRSEVRRHDQPILLLGNPPWVTNAGLGLLRSKNLPEKTNFQGHRGFDAKTGKANFDISEWMLIQLLEAVDGREATIAMLVKTAVARKVLMHAWKANVHLHKAEIRHIDALHHFDASVSACLLIATLSSNEQSRECRVFSELGAKIPQTVIGWRDGFLVADVRAYDRSKHLWGKSPLKWRSGVKHDCSKVMEFRTGDDGPVNGMHEQVDLEETYLYPLLKTSEVAKENVPTPRRAVLVTQQSVGEDTATIAEQAPRTWAYLEEHGDALDRRGSSIYRKRPRFSVFGVGDYTFLPWKVAISGFYKQTRFSIIPPFKNRPVMVDDATYFLGFQTEEETRFVHNLLESKPAQDFLKALAFMDAKRPITVDLLQRLDLAKVADELGMSDQYVEILGASHESERSQVPSLPFHR